MKAQIINHPISCISKLLSHTITVKAHLMRPQPARPLFLRSQRPPNANVYLMTLPCMSFQYIIYSVHKGSHALIKCFSSIHASGGFNRPPHIAVSISISIGLLIILHRNLISYTVSIYARTSSVNSCRLNSLYYFLYSPLITCIHCTLYSTCKFIFHHPHAHEHIQTYTCVFLHSNNVCTYKVFINQSSLLPSCWNPIKQRMERARCWYVNVCKWRALLQRQSHWLATGIFSIAVATGKKPQCHGPRVPCPLKSNPQMGFHCSVRSSFNSLTKSLYLKLGIVLNVCTIRTRLNQLWSSKLNQGFIIELMIRILMPLYMFFLFATLLDV